MKYALTNVSNILPIRDGIVPMSEQARLRGVDVPVGETAGKLRSDGWIPDPEVPDHAVLSNDAESSTGYIWRHGRPEQVTVYDLAH